MKLIFTEVIERDYLYYTIVDLNKGEYDYFNIEKQPRIV